MSRISMFLNRLAAIAISASCTTTALCIVPTASVSVAADALCAAEGVSYLHSEALTEKIAETWAGDVNLYLDGALEEAASLPLDTCMDIDHSYYVSAGKIKTYGWQCYIYAQGAFAHLFDELPLHGAQTTKDFGISYKKLCCVMGATPEASFRQFLECRVMPGAYMRTTANIDGTYNGSYGHSLLILGYDEDGVTVQEGNAQNHGEIRSVTVSWDEFNRIFLAGKNRYVSHVVQPLDSVYLTEFGLCYDFTIPDEIRYENHSVELHRIGCGITLLDATEGFEWVSSDEKIASVDKLGSVTIHESGKVTITATDRSSVHTFDVNVNAVDWEQLGDADGDGDVTPQDAIVALSDYADSMLDTPSSLSENQRLLCDVDNNGVVDPTDATDMLRFYSEKSLLENDSDAQVIWAEIIG